MLLFVSILILILKLILIATLHHIQKLLSVIMSNASFWD